MEEVNIFQLKTTLHLPTLLQLHLDQIQLNITIPNTAATQTIDDNQTPSTSRINMTKTNDVLEHPEVTNK